MLAQKRKQIIWPISLRLKDYVTPKKWDLRPLRKSNVQKKYCNVCHIRVIPNSIGI